MTVLLISFGMLFLTLFLGVSVYRLTSDVWPPMGMPKVDLFLPSLSSLVILASSFTYFKFHSLFKLNGLLKKSLFFWFATLVFAFSFLAIQFLFWTKIHAQGLLVSAGLYPSLIHALTWIHAAHIVMGILALLWPAFSFFSWEKQVNQLELRILNVGKFWHFLGIVWIMIFLFLFVL